MLREHHWEGGGVKPGATSLGEQQKSGYFRPKIGENSIFCAQNANFSSLAVMFSYFLPGARKNQPFVSLYICCSFKFHIVFVYCGTKEVRWVVPRQKWSFMSRYKCAWHANMTIPSFLCM